MDERQQQALAAWIAKQAGAEDCKILEVRPLSGGAIQENWLIRLELQEGAGSRQMDFVLRADAPSGVAVSHGRAEEFALLKAAREAGVSAPEPFWLASGEGPLGRPFYLMSKAEGVALGPKVVRDTRLGGDRRALAERLGRELAKIHSIEPPRTDLAFLGEPPRDPARSFIEEYRAHLDKLGQPRPALEWALRWLERNLPPPPERITLLHNDFRTGNYMLDEEGLTAILDWEFAGWGDPAADLGWFCAACWRFSRPDLEAGGIASREDFYRGYEAESGRSIDEARVRYWEVAAHVRWGVIAVQQGRRHWSGAEQSLELALTGRIAAELDLAALQMTAPEGEGAAPAEELPPLVDRPDGQELLVEARRLLREELMPQLQGELRYKAAMIANAMGMAARELAAVPRRDVAASLAELVAAIRRGEHDDAAALHAALLEDAQRRTELANPSVLERQRATPEQAPSKT